MCAKASLTLQTEQAHNATSCYLVRFVASVVDVVTTSHGLYGPPSPVRYLVLRQTGLHFGLSSRPRQKYLQRRKVQTRRVAMSSPYDYQLDPYRRERLPHRPPSQVTSPPYPYYPGRPGSTTSTYAPAPTVVSVPRDIIHVQAPPPQPRNFLRDLVAPDPPKTPMIMSYSPQPPSQQKSLLQPPRYTDGPQYHRPPAPPSQNLVYNPVNGLPAAPVRSPAVHNVFHEGKLVVEIC